MRTTVETIVHHWANDPGYEKRLGSLNVFAEAGVIYSYGYHFPMARWVENRRGARAVLFTKRTYSSTTSKHLSLVRRAIPDNVPVFEVPDVGEFAALSLYAPGKKRGLYVKAHAALVAEANHLFAKASRSRTMGECHIERARKMLVQARAFSSFFALGVATPAGMEPEVAEKIIAEQRERAEVARAAHEAAHAVWEAERRERDAADFAAWLAGARGYCPASYRQDANGSAYLRTVRAADGDEVETSQGATVPFGEAVRAFAFVKLCRMTGRRFESNGSQVRIGSFPVRVIEATGDLTIGCHFLTWERIEEWARGAGVADEPASPSAVESAVVA
jgi:hypothetical protein